MVTCKGIKPRLNIPTLLATICSSNNVGLLSKVHVCWKLLSQYFLLVKCWAKYVGGTFNCTSNMLAQANNVELFLFVNSTSPTLGTFCGTSRPYPVYSTGPYLRVTLHGSRTGMNLKHSFKAQFNVIDKEPIPKTGVCM